MEIVNITTEYLINPIGIDIRKPRINWNLNGVNKQLSYEIKYTINGKNKTTGIIKTDSMHHDFNEEFNSKDYVEFTIEVNTDKGMISSNTNHFEMGLLNIDDFKAKWISGNYKVNKKHRYPVDYFKKEFECNEIIKARLYITSLGLYKAYINNNEVGSFVLAPGSTDYNKRVQYQTYDVTNLLRVGKNEITVELADGWYRGSIGAKGFEYVFGTNTALYLQLEIEDSNGNINRIISDNSFKWSNDGKIRFADLKDGEIIDNNLAPSYSFNALEIKEKRNFCASNNYYIEKQESFDPINCNVLSNNSIVYEFKHNLAGIISFNVSATKGQIIKIKMGELLDDDGHVSLSNIQIKRKNKLTPKQEIIFICKDGLNSYQSSFMISGFKYVEFEGVNKIDDLKQIALYSRLPLTSSFECSNDLINIFHNNTLWSLKSNSADVPTDCPTRERMGWTGDSQVFFNTASYLTNYAPFSRKHVKDIYDRQYKDGRLPQIAPYNAEDWFMWVMNGSVGWADSGILIPYRFYLKYNDDRILLEYYDRMVKYVEFMIRRCGRAKGIYSIYTTPLKLSKENRKFGVNTGQSYGEWAEPNDVCPISWLDFCKPHPEESMAYTIYVLKTMLKINGIINRNEKNDYYQYYIDGITKAYQELVNKDDRFNLDTNRQAKLVRPLYMNLLTNKQADFAKKRLVKALENYDYRLGTGFLSTPFILDVLCEYDVNSAYRLLENEKMPGWLFMALNDTSTIWEGWEGPKSQNGIASLNHYSKGAMVEWLYKGMCGINISKENEFIIKPIIGGTIKYAKASYQSIYGTLSVSWKKDEKITFDIEVPSNTKAFFIFNDISKELLAGSYHFEL